MAAMASPTGQGLLTRILHAIRLNSIGFRLVLTFLCIVIPLYLVGIFSVQRSIEMLREEVASSMSARARFLMDYLEREVDHVKALLSSLMNDNDLNRLAVIPESFDVISKYQAIGRVQQRLQDLKNASDLVGTVGVHIRRLERTLSARGIDPLDPADLDPVEGAPSTSGLAYVGERIVFRMAFPPLEPVGPRIALFVVEIDIASSRFSQILSGLRDSETDGFLLASRSSGKVLASSLPGARRGSVEGLALAEPPGRPQSLTVEGTRSLAVVVPSQQLGMSLVYYRSEREIQRRLAGMRYWALGFSVLSALLLVAFATSVSRMIAAPVNDLVSAFRRLESGDFRVRIGHRGAHEFAYLFAAFDQMTTRLEDLIDQSYRQTILVQKAELRQLQSQINPHFLYNTFFMLYSTARAEGAEAVADLTRRLGTYYQFVTRSEEEVTLAREVEHARIYADIQELRHAGRICIEFEPCPPDCAELRVPRLILQPLLENALEHGLKDVLKDGRLAVRFEVRPTDLAIVVEDNGRGMEEAAWSSLFAFPDGREEGAYHTALSNIHRRLRLKFGTESGLRLERASPCGVRSTILIRLAEPRAAEG